MADYQGTIFVCAHCGEHKSSKSKHCRLCVTAKQRSEQDEENIIIRAKLKEKYGRE